MIGQVSCQFNEMMSMDSSTVLQHPRRNLGNRYRSQAARFVKLANKDPSRQEENLAWAEQNAQQAVLYDFTDERNWRCLAEIKSLRKDGDGLRLVLEDLFTVLGRDPDRLNQLIGVDHLKVGLELLEAAFLTDSLNPDSWFSKMDENSIQSFAKRCTSLDFTDQRANIIYGRRQERIRQSGQEELFIELVHHLLAHRPANHELWMELGRLHERRNEIDQAWLCYDHVQQITPSNEVRDLFLSRLHAKMDGKSEVPWSGPSLETRSDFLKRMQSLSHVSRLEEKETEDEVITDTFEVTQRRKLENLIESGESAEAFFMARSLVTSGESWAEELMIKAQKSL